MKRSSFHYFQSAVLAVSLLLTPNGVQAFPFNSPLNIFGNYQFIEPIASDPLKSIVARIAVMNSEDEESHHCSGVIVTPNIILTVAHCVLRDVNQRRGRFNPTFSQDQIRVQIQQQIFTVNQVIVRSRSPGRMPHLDLALLQIQPGNESFLVATPPQAYPDLSPSQPNQFENNQTVSLYGFSALFEGGHRLSYDRNCALFSIDSRTFDTTCSFSVGASGGPVFQSENTTSGRTQLIGLVHGQRLESIDDPTLAHRRPYWTPDFSNRIVPIAPHRQWILAQIRRLGPVNPTHHLIH